MSFDGFYQIKKTIKTRNIFSPFSVLIITIILLSYNLFNFINLKAVNILFWDQWDLFQAFFNQSNFIEIFRWQHGPIRQGIAFVINGFLQQLTAWNTHTESLFIGIIIFTACLLAIYLKYKLFQKIKYSDIIIPLIFLNLSQFELFIGTPNPSHGSFSLLFLILYLLSWLIKNTFRKYLFINIFNFLLIYTGMGLFIGFLTPLLFLLDYIKQQKSFKLLIINLVFSMISIGSFFVNYHVQPAAECFKFPDPNFFLYPFFISRMFSNFVNLQTFGIISYIFGSLVFVLILYILIKSVLDIMIKKPIGSNQIHNQYLVKIITIILLSFSVIFAINTSLGRLCLGIGFADSSRYCTYLIPAFFGIYLYVLNVSNLKQESLKKMFFIIFVIILLYSNFTVTSKPEINWYSEGKTNWKECYLKYEDIDLCNKYTNFRIYPNSEQTNLKYKLDYLKVRKLNLYNQN